MAYEMGLETLGANYVLQSGAAIAVDLTVFVLVVVFLLMMVVLNRLIFQPYLRLKEARYSRIEGAKATAEENARRAEEKMEEYQRQLNAARKEAVATRLEMRQSAKLEEQQIVGQTRSEVDELLKETRSELQAEMTRAESDLLRQTEELSKLIVQKVLPS